MSQIVLDKSIRDAIEAAFKRANAFVNENPRLAAESSPIRADAARKRAMEMLNTMRKGILRGRIVQVPYKYLDLVEEDLNPISTSWIVFQLYDAMQRLVEFIGQDPANEINVEDIVRIFTLVGNRFRHGEPPSVLFIRDDATPRARRAILNTPGFPTIATGTVTAQILGAGGRHGIVYINATNIGPTLRTPPSVFWDNANRRWDATRD